MISRAAVKAGAAAVVLAAVLAGCADVPVRDNSAPAARTFEQVAIAPAAIEEAAPVDQLIEGTQAYTAAIQAATEKVRDNDYGTRSRACRSEG